MPRIAEPDACAVPVTASRLERLKASASRDLLTSRDDLVTARSWQALCAMRCAQLGLPEDSDETTTLSRAVNFRKRARPRLLAGLFANAACQARTRLSMRELLSSSTAAVAARLGADLRALAPTDYERWGCWLNAQQRAGNDDAECTTRRG